MEENSPKNSRRSKEIVKRKVIEILGKRTIKKDNSRGREGCNKEMCKRRRDRRNKEKQPRDENK
jgi:hypothetical protein